MFSIVNRKQSLRPGPLSISLLALFIGVGVIAYAKVSRGAIDPYSLAVDLPRGALVYAQFQDLPALLKRWDESHLKQQFLSSTSYEQFRHRHLALKLMQRWEEFSDGLGFPLDTASIGGVTEAKAAIAIYDIGRLDIVFITPLSEEKIAATKFFTDKDRFEETDLPDGTTYYHQDVEADRGRRKQSIAFATLKGRFILATNEGLLLRTIANIHGSSGKDRLSEEPAFKTLSAVASPHSVTVWVDQAKLNDDWYFRRYWLMRNVEQLQGVRAGIFDLEMKDEKWTERRDLLTSGKQLRGSANIVVTDAERILAMIPEDVPFFKLQSLGNDPVLMNALVHDTLLSRVHSGEKQINRFWSWTSYRMEDFGAATQYEDEEYYDPYSYLNGDYDSVIDDPEDAKISEREEPGRNPLASELEHQFASSLQEAIAPARPVLAAVATSPQTITGPLFVEFRKVAILMLQAPGSLRQETLENAISKAAQSRLTIAGPSVKLKWVSHGEGNQMWRELQLPVLGWRLCYALQGRELIFTNSSELLETVLVHHHEHSTFEMHSGLADLTVIRLDRRRSAFDDIVNQLDSESITQARNESTNDLARPSQEFFSGNISSLLDAASDVSRIEIRRSSFPNRLHEEIDLVLR